MISLYSFDDYDLFADVATRRGAFVLKVSMASVADEYIHQRTTTSQGDDDDHHNDHNDHDHNHDDDNIDISGRRAASLGALRDFTEILHKRRHPFPHHHHHLNYRSILKLSLFMLLK